MFHQAEEELDRLSKAMGFMEKGKIRVKGLLELEPAPTVPTAAAVEENQIPQEAES